MANTIELPNLKFFQWQRPGAANPRLELGIGLTDTTIVVSNPPLDENGDVITGDFIFGVRNTESYVENIYVPPGEVSADGLTFTNVVRGVNLAGLDYNTSVPSLIAKHGADSAVSCNVTAVYESILAACLRGQTVRTNGVNFILGTGSSETVTVSRDDGTVRGWLRYTVGNGVQYSNDGSTWVNISPSASSSLVAVTAADTSPGYLDDKIVVTSNNPVLNIQTNVLNPGGGEDLEVEVDLDTVVVSTGAGDADKVVVTDAVGKIDGTLIPLISSQQVKIYGVNSYGDNTSQYDITNPSGDTFRYTYDGTGANPFIGTNSMITGQIIDIISSNFNANNTGQFVVTNVGNNFFEVLNPSGVPQNDVTRGTGRIGSPNEYTPNTNAVKIKVEIWAGGGGGSSTVQQGGSGGAYNRRDYFPFEISAPVSFSVGEEGAVNTDGGDTIFDSNLTAYAGTGGSASSGSPGFGGGGILSRSVSLNSITVRGQFGGRPSNTYSTAVTSGQTRMGVDGTYGGGHGGLHTNDTNNNGVVRPGDSYWGGGGSTAAFGSNNQNYAAGSSVYGGGAGGTSGTTTTKSPGTSVFGGNGGASGVAGGIKGGGGGNGARGGAGLVQITEYFI